jgi:hypothetical protein
VSTYSEKLRDPRWQRRRLEKLQKADFHCESCSDGKSTLHVHHRIYRKGADPWEYTDKELVVLCESCHDDEHRTEQLMREAICAVDRHFYDPSIVTLLVSGYCLATLPPYFRTRAHVEFFVDIARKLSEEGERDEFFLAGFMAGSGLPSADPYKAAIAEAVVLP